MVPVRVNQQWQKLLNTQFYKKKPKVVIESDSWKFYKHSNTLTCQTHNNKTNKDSLQATNKMISEKTKPVVVWVYIHKYNQTQYSGNFRMKIVFFYSTIR